MACYYNIHTHKPASNTPEIVSIQSLYENFHLAEPGNKYSIGLHPAYLGNHEVQFALIEKMAGNNEIVAIGECGLDKLVHTPMPVQVTIFGQHIALANQYNRPLIIHCVQAHEEVLQVFSKHRPTVPVIFHGFNKRHTIANKIIAKGYYLSFGAAILRAQAPAIEVLQYIADDQFLLETDDADASIKDIYARAAQIRQTNIETLILQVADNYKKVFTT